MEKLSAFVGIFVLIGIAYLFSQDRAKIPWKTVGLAVALQLVLVVLVLGIPALGFSGPLRFLFQGANDAIVAFLGFTKAGSSFVFGDLVNDQRIGFIFAFQVLPPIIFIGAVMGILYRLGIMQPLVNGIAWVMFRVLKISGAESLAAAANIFIGQTEAPLVVKPFIEKMTRSELLTLMIGGMATVAGGILAALSALLMDKIPDIAGHLLTASVMSAPAAILFAKMLLPETQKPQTLKQIPKDYKIDDSVNFVDAAAKGASEGMTLSINVVAMLVAFVALIALVDGIFGEVGRWIGFKDFAANLVPAVLQKDGEAVLSLSLIMGYFFAPFAFFMGIPIKECISAGVLLGQKTILNEFVAYLSLSKLSIAELSQRSQIILSYSLCGFANLSSIAIQIGGIGGLVPSRRSDLAHLGWLALLGGTLATFLTGTIAALFL